MPLVQLRSQLFQAADGIKGLSLGSFGESRKNQVIRIRTDGVLANGRRLSHFGEHHCVFRCCAVHLLAGFVKARLSPE